LTLVARNTQCYTPDIEYADYYVACHMIPVRSDEVFGDPVLVVGDGVIALDEPPRPIPNCPRDPTVGKTMRFPFSVDIMQSSIDGFSGFEVVKTGKSFTPRDKHLGRILRVVTDTSDAVLGEVLPARPYVIEVGVNAKKWHVGYKATIAIKHKYVSPDRIEIAWVRCSSNFEQIVALDTPEYVLQPADTDFSVKVIATPFDDAGKRLTPVSSPKSPVIQPEELLCCTITGDPTGTRSSQSTAPPTFAQSRGTALMVFGQLSLTKQGATHARIETSDGASRQR
jgi:hypothetical protein